MDMDMGLGLDGDAAGGVGARGAGRLHGDCEADVWVGGWAGFGRRGCHRRSSEGGRWGDEDDVKI